MAGSKKQMVEPLQKITYSQMSIYTKIISRLIFPIHEKLKGHTSVLVRKKLEQSQWENIEQLRGLQLERLQTLLQSAYMHVPYYCGVMDERGINPDAMSSLKDLERFPFLNKELIRANTDQLKADNATGLSRFNTGGSTGEPLIFFIGKERVSHDVAAKWRATRWWGVDIGDPEIVVWGSPVELGTQDRVREIRDRLLRTQLIPAFEMSEENLDRFVSEICNNRPKMLFGYPSSLSHIGRHARNKGIAMDNLGIKVAFVTSEQLYADQRKDIEEIFGCPVANGYGGRDAGFIAHQCPDGGMHITAEDIIVEIIDPAGNVLPVGEAGEIVVTHLATKDFPFIRYRTGDIGVLDDATCKCGRGLPLLKEIQGRTTDFIVAQDGTVMHGLALIYVIRDLPGVRTFKIIQESLDHTYIQLVVGDDFDHGHLKTITEGIRQRLGGTVKVDIELMDLIPAEASGKYRYVVSRVSP